MSEPQIEHEPPKLDVYRVEHAKLLQRRGLTFSEIAARLNLDRQLVVSALYWELLR